MLTIAKKRYSLIFSRETIRRIEQYAAIVHMPRHEMVLCATMDLLRHPKRHSFLNLRKKRILHHAERFELAVDQLIIDQLEKLSTELEIPMGIALIMEYATEIYLRRFDRVLQILCGTAENCNTDGIDRDFIPAIYYGQGGIAMQKYGDPVFTTRLPAWQISGLKKVAMLQGSTASKIVQELIGAFLQKHGITDQGEKPIDGQLTISDVDA